MAKQHDGDIVEVELDDLPQEEPARDEAQVAELMGDLQRVQADFVNYKRRAEAERADLMNLAKTRVVREFLGSRDNFDRLLASRPADLADNAWAKSLDSLSNEFDASLKRLGVERFVSVGQAFDPHLHEAIAMDDGEGAHEVVTEELQAGYKLGDQILRHAMVKVGRTDAPVDSAKPAADPVEVLESEGGEDDDVQPEAGA